VQRGRNVELWLFKVQVIILFTISQHFPRELPFAAAGRIGIEVMGSLKGVIEKLKS
jgi:hypothetical protein